MAIKSRSKNNLGKNKNMVFLNSAKDVNQFDTKKQGFLQKNFLPYSFPLLIVGLTFLILFVLNLALLFGNSPEFYMIRFLYVLLLVGFFLWSVLICAIFGILTNFIILDGLMPLLNCDLNKLNLKNYLKLPLFVFSLVLLSLIISAVGLYLNSFLGISVTINFLYVIIFALFLGSVIIVKRTVQVACRSDFLSYLVSIIFVLINYVQFLVIFITIFLVLILTAYFVFAGFA